MNWMKKLLALCSMLVVLCSAMSFAEEAVPYADSEFVMASAALDSSKMVTFSCATHQKKESIAITKCFLQKKTNNVWMKVRDLDVPSYVAVNTNAYASYMDYSDQIGSGTFRVGFTVDADGHAITRYSNSRTF